MDKISAFNGLNNVTDPVRLGIGWLKSADNVDISDTGALSKRMGHALVMNGNFTSAYASEDMQRMFVADATTIYSVTSSLELTAVGSLSSTAPLFWTEVNKHTYYNNGVDSGVLPPTGVASEWRWPTPGTTKLSAGSGSLPGGQYRACCTYLLPDGSETGAGAAQEIMLDDYQSFVISSIPQEPGLGTLLYIAPTDSDVFHLVGVVGDTYTWNSSPDELGTELSTQFLDTLPVGSTAIQHWRGQMFAAQHMQAQDQSVVWASEPLGYHLFNLNSGFFMVPGEVLMLAPTPDALIVGTRDAIFAFTGNELRQLAPYGVVPGLPWVRDDDTGSALLWTTRGVVRASPFENLTNRKVSLPPGTLSSASLIRKGGQTKFVASITPGGTAFNPRT